MRTGLRGLTGLKRDLSLGGLLAIQGFTLLLLVGLLRDSNRLISLARRLSTVRELLRPLISLILLLPRLSIMRGLRGLVSLIWNSVEH